MDSFPNYFSTHWFKLFHFTVFTRCFARATSEESRNILSSFKNFKTRTRIVGWSGGSVAGRTRMVGGWIDRRLTKACSVLPGIDGLRQIGVVVDVDDDSTSVTRWLRYKTRVAFQIELNCLLSLEDKNPATCAAPPMYRWHNWTRHSWWINISTLFCVSNHFVGSDEMIGVNFW